MADIDFQNAYEYTKNISLLYVEDDEALRRSSTDLFTKLFKTLLVASDGKEAIEMYKRYHEENGEYIDLVITDILMPVMNGMELIAHIHKLHTDQVIIVLSAYNDADRLLSLIELGIDSFMVKPIEYQPMLQIFYKFGQRIQDRKTANEYHKKLEEMNIKLKEAYGIISQQKKQLEDHLKQLQ